MSSVWPSDCGFVSLTTNIIFRRGSSSSCCKSSSTSECAKRLRKFLSWEIILFLFGLPDNFSGPTPFYLLVLLEGVSGSCHSLLRYPGCSLVWTLFSLSIFSSMDLESLLTELSKEEPKLYRRSFSVSINALNCVSCFSRSTYISFFPSLIE